MEGEYVKIKLETYDYFRELEHNRKLKDAADFIKEFVWADTYMVNEFFSKTESLVVNKEKLSEMITESLGYPRNMKIIWE